MKFNLKNRPNASDFDTGIHDELDPTCTKIDSEGWARATFDWFEGFEKELRGNIKELRNSRCNYHQLVARGLEEILGE